PAERAARTALDSDKEKSSRPQLALMMCAPWVRAYSRQAMASDTEPLPELSANLQDMICTRQATPTTPKPLSPPAPITPAMVVPWPLSSCGYDVPATALVPWLPSSGLTHIF